MNDGLWYDYVFTGSLAFYDAGRAVAGLNHDQIIDIYKRVGIDWDNMVKILPWRCFTIIQLSDVWNHQIIRCIDLTMKALLCSSRRLDTLANYNLYTTLIECIITHRQ